MAFESIAENVITSPEQIGQDEKKYNNNRFFHQAASSLIGGIFTKYGEIEDPNHLVMLDVQLIGSLEPQVRNEDGINQEKSAQQC
ncbi:hypothetical protein [Peribacillus simplex]|uniref:Uncharacterized protein n=1 Tax=Peribacillus simplex TaxID=1478 RepID=A0AAW7IL09_9BACI|nr:hypothetical protein [Peribacillus simplex]MDM5455558.1 hypothetical protein [Peribacillus simplex]